MSDTPIDSATTDSVASAPVAPAANSSMSGTPESTPASGDATASEAKPAADEANKQSRSESRRQANQRREIRELHREIGYMKAQLEANRPPAQADQTGQPAGERRPAPDVSTMRAAAKAQLVMERLEDAGDDIEGFDKVLAKITHKDFPITDPIVDFLVESDKAPQVVAWLADHPEKAAEISVMSEWRADKALEKIAASLTTTAPPPPPRTTNTPPPPPTVNGRGTPQFDPEKASMEDYAKHWAARRAARSG